MALIPSDNHVQKTVEHPEPNALLVFLSGASCYIVSGFSSSSLSLQPTELSLPRVFRDDLGARIIDSCNGLVCKGSGKFLNSYVIFNPTYPRECKVVPYVGNVAATSHKKADRYIDRAVSGFGYDRETDDYKIVYIWRWTRYKGMIYSLKSDSWKPLHVPDMGKEWTYCGALNSYLHYVTETNNGAIIQFDLFSEQWGVVYLPPGPQILRDVCVLDGCLSCVVVPHNCGCPEELWIMKEYGVQDSWTKVLSLPYRGCSRAKFYSARLRQFLLYRENFGLFWYGSDKEEESSSKEEEEITRVNIEGELKISDIRVIEGSLVSVDSLQRQRENNLLESRKEGDSKEAENPETNGDLTTNNKKNKKNKKKNRAQN